MSERDPFETSEMGLAVYLSLSFEILEVSWRGRSCFWVFPAEEGIYRAAGQYRNDLARVNPREYNDNYGKMKREMFRLKEVMTGKASA